jgi:hypothetical protein
MADRADVLAGLQRELRHARDVGEVAYIRQLEAQIAKYSAGTPANPATETTAAVKRPARSKTT